MITLRSLQESDAPELQKKKYRTMTIVEIQEMIQNMNSKLYHGNYFELFAILKDSEIVGTISIQERSPSIISCGVEILNDYRRNGYAYDALSQILIFAKEKGYKIATAQIRADNVASISLHKKAGFETDFYEYVNKKGNPVYIMLRAL